MPNILIVGAGIAGLALAQRLQSLDIPYRIIEQNKGPSIAGCGIALPFNAVDSMERLGLKEQLMAISYPVQEIIYAKSDGSVLTQKSLTEPPFQDSSFVALHRNQLLNLLVKGLEETVEWGTCLEDVKSTSDGVEVETNKWQERFELVVAADGVNSKTRRILEGSDAVDHKFNTWRFMANQSNHDIQPTYLYGGTDMFMAYPVSEDQIYCYGQVFDESLSNPKTGSDETDILELFKHYGGIVPRLLENMSSETIIPGRVLTLEKPAFRRGRVAFVGDAGNGCTPMLQQGAASAFEDTLCLSAQLGQNSIDEALENYSQLRKPRVEWVMATSNDPFKQLHKLDNFFLQVLRNWMFRRSGPNNFNGWRELATNERLVFYE